MSRSIRYLGMIDLEMSSTSGVSRQARPGTGYSGETIALETVAVDRRVTVQKFEFAHIAEGIARQAGALLRGFYAKGVATEYKGDVDLVTEADRASEQLIVEKLKAAFPSHGVYGEEGTRSGLESEDRWYVDPLDGTTNFAHGFPAFCVVLGLERREAGLAADAGSGSKDQDGEMVAGVIYDPLRD